MFAATLPLAGRILIGGLFAVSGLQKLLSYDATTAFISAAGLPLPPIAYLAAVAIELIGGSFLVIGWHTRYVAASLAFFTIVAAICFHNNFADQNQVIHFTKNLMIAAGLLQFVRFGSGTLPVFSGHTTAGTNHAG